MNPMYDVVILGCGEAGIFAAYELARLHPDLKITALDQGRDIYHRSCPIVAGKVKECIHCPVCASAGPGPSLTESSTSPPSSAAGSPTSWTPGR